MAGRKDSISPETNNTLDSYIEQIRQQRQNQKMTELSIAQKCALDQNNDSLIVVSNSNENEIAKYDGASESMMQSTVQDPAEPIDGGS